ncbi:MAG: HlyC/CorC family transporter [Rhodocyclaceae bacterium]|nr:HlyC/CorC family transporter [Rhodocyclaceae bacterium]
MKLLILFLLIILNGLFAMSEIALVAARRARLAKRAQEGDRAAALAMQLGEEPTRFLSTVQIGITSIGILYGVFSEHALSAPLAVLLQDLGLNASLAGALATGVVVILITFVSIVIGELVPKRVAQLHAETIARIVAPPMSVLASISRPFVWLLTGATELVLRLLGQRNTAASAVTEEEIHAIIDEGTEAGVIEKTEQAMVRNVFRLDERPIASLMVPRADIVWLDISRPLQENIERLMQSPHLRFPVCRGGLDDILGVINAKQLFRQQQTGDALDLSKGLEDAVYVPESLSGMALLNAFRARNTHIMFVIDEYGEVQGMVTMHDLIESLTGEFQTDNSEEAWSVARADGSWLLDGLIPVMEMKDCLALRSVPDEGKSHYHTLSGMVMWLLGRMPTTGDVVEWEGWTLEVVDMDGKRIDKVLAQRRPEETVPAGEAPAASEEPRAHTA